MKYSLSLLFCVLLVACESGGHHEISFVNNSDRDIYVDWSDVYPDTTRAQWYLMVLNAESYKILSHNTSTKALSVDKDSWENTFRQGIPSDTVMVFIYDANLLEAHQGHSGRLYDFVIQRYDLSFQDIESLNWTLTYPPSSKMSKMKMYPPYGK
ncbi:MAG: hypothetical protein BGN96_07925 [Bacteroidales bacterium 45-6]|nr:MAG: hypothetical protein BGN96_07925 [Bacteroidales bacterium 45-6]